MTRKHRHFGGISSIAIRRPVGTVAITSVVIVLGVFFLSRLTLDLLPEIVYPQIRAGADYSGVAPQVMEEQVTKALETALAVTEGVVRLESETTEGRSGVNLHFGYGTDVNFALQEASKNLDRARGRLPREMDPPTIYKFDPSQSPIFEVAFSSPTRDLIDLRDWVDLRLRPQLLTVEGVASVDVSGGLTREIQVTLDQERIRSYGLTVSDILNQLRDENQDVAAGQVASSEYELVGKTTGKFQTVDDIRDVLLPVPGSARRVPLSEVAAIRDTHRDQRLWARLDGVPAVKLSVRKQPDANTVLVATQVDDRLSQLAGARFVPEDIQFEIISDQSFFIENAVAGVRNAALAGAALAMLVVLLFLGSLRKTFVIGLSIPIAVLATFVMMGLGGLTLNILSLGGLALGVGMLVDNSIVMLENIFRHRALGDRDPVEAAHHGAAEVTSAVTAATATSLAAVLPFLLISGLTALIFRELILTISFAIVASLAVALTMVPMLAAQTAKIQRESGLARSRPYRAFNAGLESVTRLYRRVARRIVRHRWIVLGGAFATLAGALFVARSFGTEFLPTVDDGQVGVFLRMPEGTSAERTNEIALRIEEEIATMPYVEHVFTTAGGFLFGSSTAERSGRGSMNIILVPARQRPDMPAGVWVAALQTKIDAMAVPGARIFARPPRIRGLRTNRSGSDVAISIHGDDLDLLTLVGQDIIRQLNGIPGLESLEPSADEASPQLSIEIDRQRAADLGLNVAEVGQTVRTALDGSVPTRYTDANNEYDVRVRLPRESFTSAEDLGAIALFSGTNRPIYLRDVAAVRLTSGPTTILRENQNRLIRITGDINSELTTVGEVNREIRARLDGFALPEGYGLVYGGEEQAIRENQRNLLIVTSLAVFLVLVVMAVQYESLKNPFVILVSMPLAMVGVVGILWITQMPLSAPVLLGVILLTGIVVNNAILLVEYVELARDEQGMSPEEAVVEAGAIRLRPILMTTLTTILGMMPLALGLGEGSELMRPLAIAVVGGLSVSTLLTLIVIPCAYLIFTDLADRLISGVIGRKGRDPEPAPQLGTPSGLHTLHRSEGA
jgi:CzcA family heavy metal efflux pump